MEGLEISECRLGVLERTKRLDAEFFLKRHLQTSARLQQLDTETIPEIADVADGNHFAISGEFVEEGIPYYRGQDVVGHFFIEQASPYRITRQAFDQDFMKRSHLRQGDVLLSIIGTIGELSLVKQQEEATCSCKLAILRPKRVSPEYLAAYLASPIGRLLTERWKRGAVQMGLLLEDMDQLVVPRWRGGLEERIKDVVDAVYDGLEEADRAAQDAEQSLLCALDLENWQPPEPLTYTRRASDVFAAGRFDAEHYQEKYYALADRLRAYPGGCVSLGTLCPKPANGVEIREYEDEGVPYLRISDIKRFTLDAQNVVCISAAAAAREIEKVRLNVGDVLVSRSGSLAVTGVVEPKWRHAVISSHLIRVRIEDKRFDPYYVAAFLAGIPGRLQIEQRSNGAVQPEISQPALKAIVLPLLDASSQKQIRDCIQAAHASHRRAQALLERAKRAVEIAIEESEAAALRFLAEPEQ